MTPRFFPGGTIPAEVTECIEHVLLKQSYDAAFRAWEYSRDLLFADSRVPSGPRTKDLLHARLQAAKKLYDHSLNCPVCSRVKQQS
jgi:hypothetical protein